MTTPEEKFKIVTSLPEHEQCVSMIQFKDFIYLATEKHVYRLVEDKLELVRFAIKDDEVK